MSYSEEVKREIDRGINGDVTCIPIVHEKLGEHVSINQAMYTIIGGQSGTGKTSFTDYTYVLQAYKWFKEQKKKGERPSSVAQTARYGTGGTQVLSYQKFLWGHRAHRVSVWLLASVRSFVRRGTWLRWRKSGCLVVWASGWGVPRAAFYSSELVALTEAGKGKP